MFEMPAAEIEPGVESFGGEVEGMGDIFLEPGIPYMARREDRKSSLEDRFDQPMWHSG